MDFNFGYTKAQRDATPTEDFAGPHASFPIKVKGDVRKAWDLAGHAADPDAVRAKIRAIAKRKGWEDELPATAKETKMAKGNAKDMSHREIHSAIDDAVRSKHSNGYVDTVYPLAAEVVYHDGNSLQRDSYTMSDDGMAMLKGNPFPVKRTQGFEPIETKMSFAFADEHFAHYRGEIFREGDYPDKGVAFDAPDIDRLAKTQSAPIMIEHVPTPLDEAFKDSGLYYAERRDVVESGKTFAIVYGCTKVPKPLDQLFSMAMGGEPRKVSARISADKARIIEVSFVRDPRVETASMSTAFSKLADVIGKKPASASSTPAKEISMSKPSLKERLGTFFSRQKEALKEADIDPTELDALEFTGKKTEEKAADTSFAKLDPAVQTAIDRLTSDNLALKADKVASVSVKFADDAIAAGKFFPTDKDWIVQTFANALSVDNGGDFKFSADGSVVEGENCKRLREEVAKRPAHHLTRRQAAGTLSLVFGDTQKTDEAKQQEERSTYFSKSETGQEVLAKEKK